jgi:ABC-type branched-subunit amino acid transport system substrate-binding protein
MIKPKSILANIILLLLLINTSLADQRIKIGVSTALTGNGATLGDDIRRSLEFANEELAQGKYSFVFEDDGCSAKGAVNVAHKLINIDRVRYVIGFACSSAVLGSASIYEARKVVG